MCQLGVCYQGCCSSIAIGLSKECKLLFKKACTMPWCHTVVHFEVEVSRFCAAIQENRPDRGSISAKQAVVLTR